jgi:uncharacterized membrane protein
LELARAIWHTCARSNALKGTPTKIISFNGQLWTRREALIWLLALIVAIILGVLIVTNVLGSWALLVAPFLALGVGLMRYRAGVKRNAQQVEHEADPPES